MGVRSRKGQTLEPTRGGDESDRRSLLHVDGGLVVLLDAGRSSIAPPAWTGKGEGERCEVEHDSLVKEQAHG